jgi:hypothetical protein
VTKKEKGGDLRFLLPRDHAAGSRQQASLLHRPSFPPPPEMLPGKARVVTAAAGTSPCVGGGGVWLQRRGGGEAPQLPTVSANR